MADNAKPPADRKVSLLEMILYCEREWEGCDVWAEVYKKEGKELPSGFAYRRLVNHSIHRTLELVKAHEREFVALVTAARKKAKATPLPARAQADAGKRSTVPSSEESTPMSEHGEER